MMVQGAENQELDGILYCFDAGTLFMRGKGKLSVTTLGQFLQLVKGLVQAHTIHTSCLDLAQASYLDSTIMGNLVGIHKLMVNGLFLRNPSPEARQALEIMGLTRLLPPWPEARDFPEPDRILFNNEKAAAQDVLGAHALLSELSPENDRRFANLRTILQEEIRRNKRF